MIFCHCDQVMHRIHQKKRRHRTNKFFPERTYVLAKLSVQCTWGVNSQSTLFYSDTALDSSSTECWYYIMIFATSCIFSQFDKYMMSYLFNFYIIIAIFCEYLFYYGLSQWSQCWACLERIYESHLFVLPLMRHWINCVQHILFVWYTLYFISCPKHDIVIASCLKYPPQTWYHDI